MNSHLWWYVARSSGLVAWALATASVAWGVALSGRVHRRPGRGWTLDLHRFLGGLTVVFTVVHVAGLMLDSYVYFGLAEVAIPFASRWKPGAVAWGVVAAYLLVAVEGTSLLMRHLPRAVWRRVHGAAFALFAFSTVHMLSAGTDARHPALQWAALLAVALIGFLVAVRLLLTARIPEVAEAEAEERIAA